MTYIAPKSGLKSFTCPHCGVLAMQYHYISTDELGGGYFSDFDKNPVRTSKCEHCKKICLWYFNKMVYPMRGNAPVPNPDMPEDITFTKRQQALQPNHRVVLLPYCG